MQDLGTCFGQDTRQMLLDGMPAERITVTDLIPDYWCCCLPCPSQELPDHSLTGGLHQRGELRTQPLPSNVQIILQMHCAGGWVPCCSTPPELACIDMHRDFGKQLFMDADKLTQSEWSGQEGVPGSSTGIEAVFGSFTDPSFVAAEPPVGPLGRLAGRVTIAWAGAVLHVLSKADVRAFSAHAHAMLAPGGVFIGVRPSEMALLGRQADGSCVMSR